jgi:hypothetical protein
MDRIRDDQEFKSCLRDKEKSFEQVVNNPWWIKRMQFANAITGIRRKYKSRSGAPLGSIVYTIQKGSNISSALAAVKQGIGLYLEFDGVDLAMIVFDAVQKG